MKLRKWVFFGARRRTERGYVAVLVAIMFPLVFIALAAIAVDTARWYLEVQRVQNAADAGALAGVSYLPQDLPNATATALKVTARNGYDDAASDVQVTVEVGARPSQLRVTVTSTISNIFGVAIGRGQQTITRSAVTDFTGAVPMGSPCNTFSNEPPSQPGSDGQPEVVAADGSALPSTVNRFPNCTPNPQFWAVLQGMGTSKVWGDRYSTTGCKKDPRPASGVPIYGCSGSNSEYKPEGYFFAIKVLPDAVGVPIKVQLYDPAFVNTGQACENLPIASALTTNMNKYATTDADKRYLRGNTTFVGEFSNYCPGDFFLPDDDTSKPLTTTFVVRQQTDTRDPMKAAPVPDATCKPKQYAGVSTVPTANMLKGLPLPANAAYHDQLAKVFHNWVNMCTFTPTREGEYYLQARTNVSFAGTKEIDPAGKAGLISSDNGAADDLTGNQSPMTYGNNAFGVRVVPQVAGKEKSVSVSGWERMPIFANTVNATSKFNLVRVLPGAKGQYISFEFYDVGDATKADQVTEVPGTVQVLAPSDATGSITNSPYLQGCRAAGPVNTTNLTNCSMNVKMSTHNGKLQAISVPIPTDYDCAYTSQGGCWFQVQVSFPGANVTDITTWDAQIEGDPVRLIE